jgi:hypothetical protein
MRCRLEAILPSVRGWQAQFLSNGSLWLAVKSLKVSSHNLAKLSEDGTQEVASDETGRHIACAVVICYVLGLAIVL